MARDFLSDRSSFPVKQIQFGRREGPFAVIGWATIQNENQTIEMPLLDRFKLLEGIRATNDETEVVVALPFDEGLEGSE